MALEKELLVAYQMEERFWKVKSRVKWLKWGDNNTRFFQPSFKPGTAKMKFGGCTLRMVKGILVQKRLQKWRRSFSRIYLHLVLPMTPLFVLMRLETKCLTQ